MAGLFMDWIGSIALVVLDSARLAYRRCVEFHLDQSHSWFRSHRHTAEDLTVFFLYAGVSILTVS